MLEKVYQKHKNFSMGKLRQTTNFLRPETNSVLSLGEGAMYPLTMGEGDGLTSL